MKGVYYRKPLVREYNVIGELRNKVRSITHGKKLSRSSNLQILGKQSINNPKNYWELATTSRGKIIGYIHARIEADNTGLITSLFILPEYQGKKIGKTLMSKSMKWFQKKAVKRINLSVVFTNNNAINFYKKIGFQLEDTVPASTYKDNLNRLKMYIKI